MLSALSHVAYLMATTIIISFFVAFIIKLIVMAINFQSSLNKYDKNYLKEVSRARNIRKLRVKRLYRETCNSNEIIRNRYGMNYNDSFGLKANNNTNELVEHYYGK